MTKYGKSIPSKLVGLPACLPDGSVYGKVVAVYNFGAGEIIELQKTNGKMEMFPVAGNFISLSANGDTLIINPPEYFEAKP